MTRRDTTYFGIGAACGLFILGYLVERTIVNLPKLSDRLPISAGAANFFPAERTYGSVVGGLSSDRPAWFSDTPAT